MGLGLFQKKIIFLNLFFLIILNLLITPIFLNHTFDVPYRHPNSNKIIFWEKDYQKGFEFEEHTISTDIKGNRVNKRINYLNKDKNTLRIFAVGASTTENEGLDNSLTWSNQLIKKIEDKKLFKKKNYEIINFGVGGLRTIHHFFTIKRNMKYRPDFLILLVGVNDWNYQIINLNENFIHPDLEIYFDFRSSIFFKIFNNIYKQVNKKLVKDKTKEENTEIINDNNLMKKNPYKSHIIKQSFKKKEIKNFSEIRLENVSERYNFWLKKIIKLCNKKKLKCLFVDQPTLYYISSKNNSYENLWMNPPYQEYKVDSHSMYKIANLYNKHLKNSANNKNIRFCEISKKIDKNESFFLDDVHFTPKGANEVANNLYACIKQY